MSQQGSQHKKFTQAELDEIWEQMYQEDLEYERYLKFGGLTEEEYLAVIAPKEEGGEEALQEKEDGAADVVEKEEQADVHVQAQQEVEGEDQVSKEDEGQVD